MKGITQNITVVEEKRSVQKFFFIASCRTRSENSWSRVTRLLQGSYGLVRFVKEESLSLLHWFPDSTNSPNSYFFPLLTGVAPACTCRVNSRDKVVLTSTNDLCALFFVSGNTVLERDTFLLGVSSRPPAAVRTHWSESFIFRSLTLLSSRGSARSPSPCPNCSLN